MNEEFYHQQFPKWFSFLVVLVVFQQVCRCGECYHLCPYRYERIHNRQNHPSVFHRLPNFEGLYHRPFPKWFLVDKYSVFEQYGVEVSSEVP